MDSAAIALLLLVGVLSGGGVVAAATGCDASANQLAAAKTPPIPVRGGANQLAAAAAAAAAACTTTVHLSGGVCDTPRFATELVKFCKSGMDTPGAMCCAAVLLTVDADSGCLCRVIDSFEFIMADLSVARLWEWYKVCGGRLRSVPENKDSCKSAPSSPPPSPPPPPAKPKAPSAWKLWVALALLCAAALGVVVSVSLKLFLPRAAVPLPNEDYITTTPLTGATTGAEDGSLRVGEAATIEITSSIAGEDEDEEEEKKLSPPGCVEERSTVARPRLPPAPPFHPLPPALLLPPLLPPLAGPPLGITAY